MGAYGYEHAQTPAFDELASQGVLFERAYGTTPLTIPSHSSMFTGLYPTRHGVHSNGDAVLAEQLTTLAELLQGQGYATVAAVSAFVTTRIWSLDQGFDAYFDDLAAGDGPRDRWSRERRAEAVTDDLLAWLEARDAAEERPFFMWAHYYDPHAPYAPPQAWAQRFPDRPYDGEIAYMDSQLARLREAVQAATGQEGAHWLVIGDHGEATGGEHGEQSHGMFVFDPTMRVPFVLRPAQALAEGRVVEDLAVSGADVMPTALGLLGFEAPAGLDGVDLSPTAQGATVARPPVYMESETPLRRFGYHPEIAIAEGDLKLIDTPHAMLFDLQGDPNEEKNLLDERTEAAERLSAYGDQVLQTRVSIADTSPAPEVFEQLAALGYISSGMDAGVETPTVDAKDKLATIAQLEQARQLAMGPNKAKEVEAIYRRIIEADPGLAEARMGLARALAAQGRMEEAEATYRQAVELQPDSTVLRVNLANTLAAQGRQQEGLDLMLSVHAQVPGDEVAQVGILRMLTDLQRLDEAREHGERWLTADPGNHTLEAHLGVVLAKQEQWELAHPLLEASTADGLPRQLVHPLLGEFYMREGRTGKALEHLAIESAINPRDAELHRKLARGLMSLRRWDEAAAEYAFICELTPEDNTARLAWAQAVFNTADFEGAAEILAPALAAAPQDAQTLLLHANILAKLGRSEEAKAVFERAKAARQLELR